MCSETSAKRDLEFKQRQFPQNHRQAVLLAAWLLALAFVLAYAWVNGFAAVDNRLNAITTVPWSPPDGVYLRGGPPAFYFDIDERTLSYVGIMDAKTRLEILSLIEGGPGTNLDTVRATFRSSIDKLSFQAQRLSVGLLAAMLILGGLSGALGAHLRSFSAFIGNYCFKRQLDLSVWWPYYIVRPATGFLLGMVLVSIIQAGIFTVGASVGEQTFWWVAAAVLAGFSDDEFTMRLRQISKSLFGEEAKAKAGPGRGADPKQPTG